MKQEGNPLNKVLSNRDYRLEIKSKLAKLNYATISLTFNIPGYPKSNNEIKKAFRSALSNLKDFFTAKRIAIVQKLETIHYAESGDFFIVPISQKNDLKAVKNDLETFESTHFLGRLLDVDIFDNQLIPITSGKEKKCFICNKPAKVCAKNQQHSIAELRAFAQNRVAQFNFRNRQQQIIDKIATFAMQSILFESALFNKPGLVCPNSKGAHNDMDYFTFLASSAAISPFFKEMALLGFSQNKNESFDASIVQLRRLGLKAERTMLDATKGVNTQKGIIFLIGLACFASAHVFAHAHNFSEQDFRATIQRLSKGLVAEDLGKNNSLKTHGEQCFKKYGKELAGGARLEAEKGFPIVFDMALPYLNENIKDNQNLSQNDWQKLLEPLLYRIIATNNDVNILYRSGKDTLKEFQQMAEQITKGKQINLINFCLEKNISPGGSADMLALSLFVYFCQQLTTE